MKKVINIATSLDTSTQTFLKTRSDKFDLIFHAIDDAVRDEKISKSCTGLWVTLFPFVNERLLQLLPNVSFVATPTTGLTHIDLKLLRRKQIKLFSLKNQVKFLNDISATPEFTWGLMLNVWRKICLASKDFHGDTNIRTQFASRQLKGLSVGIIGYGRVGRYLARYGQVFGMNVNYFDPYLELHHSDTYAQRYERLSELLRVSDVVFMTASVSSVDTLPILNSHEIDFIKKGAVVINTARGVLVDESALARKLELGHISGIGVDVLRREELNYQSSHPSELEILRDRGFNIVITPHIAGMCHDAFLKCCANILMQIENS